MPTITIPMAGLIIIIHIIIKTILVATRMQMVVVVVIIIVMAAAVVPAGREHRRDCRMLAFQSLSDLRLAIRSR